MKHEKLSQALNEISDAHIAEAARPKKRVRPVWVGAVAAAAALALILTVLLPGRVSDNGSATSDGTFYKPTSSRLLVAAPNYPKYEWVYRGNEMDPIRENLADFFTSSMALTLSGVGEENQAYSPANLYIALSVVAELTEGRTQKQILKAVGCDSIEKLRQQTNTLWNACYYDDKDQVILANSVWLDRDLSYVQKTMDTLAENYYTSVYRGDFGSEKTNKAITKWLDDQTGGLLKNHTQNVDLGTDIVLAVYSTVFYRAMWTDNSEFNPSRNTPGIFHSPRGDQDVTFMNKKEHQTYYYWGEDYGAVSLGLKDGSDMWFILPDEGKLVDDVLAAGEYADMVLGASGPEQPENRKYMKVNLSVPKFDIEASGDLKEDVQAMGIMDIFDPGKSDFSASVRMDPGSFPPFVYMEAVNQATRVAIDEKGVTAASYIELPGAGAAAPPEEIIDFVLDRPFIFVITNRYGIPLFAGVVNEP